MKKGFTLIELLAVIIILGIIALIAIPVVSRVLDESRRGAFQTTVQQLDKKIEESCQREQIKDIPITGIYEITNGVISPEIDIKGDLPDNGIIYVSDDCKVTFNLNNNNFSADKEDEEIIIDNCPKGGCTNVASNKHVLLKNAAKRLVESNPDYLPTVVGKSITVGSSFLIDFDYLPVSDINPSTGKCYNRYININIKKTVSGFEYTIDTANENLETPCEKSQETQYLIIKGPSKVIVPLSTPYNDEGYYLINKNNKIINTSNPTADNEKVIVSFYDSVGTVSQINTTVAGENGVKYLYVNTVKPDGSLSISVSYRKVVVK